MADLVEFSSSLVAYPPNAIPSVLPPKFAPLRANFGDQQATENKGLVLRFPRTGQWCGILESQH